LIRVWVCFVPTVAVLQRHWFRIVVNCLTATRIYARAVLAMLRQFRETGGLGPHLAAETDLHDYEALLGLPELRAWQDARDP